MVGQSKDELQAKEEFQDVILHVMKYAGMLAIDNPGKFIDAVEVVRDLMEVYADKEFISNISESKAKDGIKGIDGPTLSFRLAKYKFRELVKLFGRSGFIPPKIVGGEIDEEAVLAYLHETGDLQELEKSGTFKIVPVITDNLDKEPDKKA